MNVIKKNKSLLICVILLYILSIINTIQGYIYGKFGIITHFYILEILSFIILVILLNRMICVHDDGKCTTIKK
jgi:hypothetical protein